MDEATLVVMGRQPVDTSRGPLGVGERVRLPLVEAIQLAHTNRVVLADWKDQQLPESVPSLVERAMTAVEAVVDAVKPKRRRYRRRDLRAER